MLTGHAPAIALMVEFCQKAGPYPICELRFPPERYMYLMAETRGVLAARVHGRYMQCPGGGYSGGWRRLFLYHMNLQIIKIDGFDEAVFGEARFVVALEVFDVGVEPDGLA